MMAKKPDKPTDRQQPGPEAERLKLDMDFDKAGKKLVDKKKPAEGWPDQDEPSDQEKD